ncbi:hypothetical protein [Maribacter thermophilus]|uniref:hypothetical protein n=1 Tax=Maribacter thermophilus TaxID=1197874 RepID=UPI0006415E5D|nr:hypothetical protein [Maribacter thermophilus]
MSKVISISISFLILLQSFGLHTDDIAQIDNFIEHAKFHSEQYGDNVLVFISKHYGELKAEHDREHQEEKEEHEQLPFQHHCHLTSVVVYTANSFNPELGSPLFSESNSSNFHYQAPSSSLHAMGLLQPPRQS